MKYKVKSGNLSETVEAVSNHAAAIVALNNHMIKNGGSLGVIIEIKPKGGEAVYRSTVALLEEMGIMSDESATT